MTPAHRLAQCMITLQRSLDEERREIEVFTTQLRQSPLMAFRNADRPIVAAARLQEYGIAMRLCTSLVQGSSPGSLKDEDLEQIRTAYEEMHSTLRDLGETPSEQFASHAHHVAMSNTRDLLALHLGDIERTVN